MIPRDGETIYADGAVHQIKLTFPTASNPATGRQVYNRVTCKCGWRGVLHNDRGAALGEGARHCRPNDAVTALREVGSK